VKLEADCETPFGISSRAHGLPIEGDWFHVHVPQRHHHRAPPLVTRSLQDMARSLARRRCQGAEGGRQRHRFGGVAIQYFASMVVVDDEQKERAFLAWSRPRC
jgi:hypothetical protein